MTRWFIPVLLAMFTPLCLSADVSFTANPTVVKAAAGAAYKIAFTVSGPTDVEVTVVGADGRVVRHLAAGMIGRGIAASAPLAADSLSQEVIWDGKDDAGQAALAAQRGPFRFTVRLGIRFEFDRVMGAAAAPDPPAGLPVGVVIGLAADANGVYIMDCGDYPIRSSPRIIRLKGSKVTTLMPGPANQADPPADRVKELWLQTASGQRIPRVYSSFQCLYPETEAMTGGSMCVAGQPGQLVFINHFVDIYTKDPPRLLRLMAADGTPPPGGYLGPLVQADEMASTPVQLAASPDGATIYATCLLGKGKWKRDLQNVVLAIERDGKGPGKVLIGEPYKAGATSQDDTHLNNPAGLAVDGKGRIYVSDHDNDRVVQCSADGKFMATLDVPAPGAICVDPKAGTIFVASGTDKQFGGGKLLRFKSMAGAGGAAGAAWRAAGQYALSDHCQTRLAWAPAESGGDLYLAMTFEDHSRVVRLTDDEKFGEKAGEIEVASTDLPKSTTFRGLIRPMYLIASRNDDRLFVRDWGLESLIEFAPRLDASFQTQGRPSLGLPVSGTFGKKSAIPAADVAFDAAGRAYAFTGGFSEPGKVTRYDADGNVVPFAEDVKGVGLPGTLRGGHMRGVRGLTVAPNGDIYVLRFKGYQDKDKGWDSVVLDVFGPDGKAKQAGLLTLSSGAGGIRVDRGGNIYVTEHLLPPGSALLDEFKAVGPVGLRVYRDVYGSIVKFGPGGGATAFSERPPTTAPEGPPAVSSNWNGSNYLGYFRVTGDVKAILPGISPVGVGPRGGGCTCFTSRFDLDEFGRLFVPDAARFSVRVLDGAGNQIARFGRYGNADDKGGIRLGWPAYVAVNDTAVYVSDLINRQVVRVKPAWAVEKSCRAE